MFRIIGKSKIALLLAILFGISLFFFKSGSRYSNLFNSDTVIASVSGTPISTSKFNRTMRMNIDNFNQMIGKEMSGDEIRAYQIHSLALGVLINDAIFESEYDNLNFKIDETVIAQKTKSKIPQLYNKKNQLDDLYLKTFLQQQQLTIDDLVKIINFDTRKEIFDKAFFKVNYPKYFSNKIENYKKHIRKVKHIEIQLDNIDIADIIEKKSSSMNDELQSLYEKNIDNYMSEESRDIEFIIFDQKNFKIDFIPSFSEIEKYYNDNKELYFEKEKRSFIQFNFKNLEEAKNFKTKIINFNDTSEIVNFAKKNNIRYNNFKDLTSNEILEEISTSLFKLRINEVSDIIETSIAKHIILLESIDPEQQLTLNSVADEIKETITSIELNNYFQELINDASELILQGKSLNEISNTFNLKIESINNLTRNYNKFNESEKNLYSNLISLAFEANKDFVNDIKNVDSNYSFALNVKQIHKSEPINFEILQNTLLEDWKEEQAIKKINDEIQLNLNNRNYISKLGYKYKIEPNEIEIQNNYSKLPRNYVSKIFKAEKNQNISLIYNKIIYIGNIEDIIIPNQKTKDNEISLIKDLKGSFGSELQKNKKISTNDNLINAILDQY